MKYQYTLLLSITLSAGVVAQDFGFIVDTQHDLGINPPVQDMTDKKGPLCVFCHIPTGNAAEIGLWDNHNIDNLFDYPYQEPAKAKTPGKPTGTSLICLSCHDGTIALGDVFSRTNFSNTTKESDADLKRKTFSDGHPISFAYDVKLAIANRNLANPNNLPDNLKIDEKGRLQCTTCHNPHNDNYKHFLVMDDRKGMLCIQCHIMPGWKQSSHAISNAIWNHSGPDPWPFQKAGKTVAQYGCLNCHTPHSAGNGKNLLTYNTEEDNCLACHNGNVARYNIKAEFEKFSHHPIENSSTLHEVNEPVLMSSSDRHVECVDCHNPHSVRDIDDNGLSGGLYNLPAIDINGVEKKQIDAEYELCFRCHADSPGKKPMPTPRVEDQNNVRLQFDNANPSYHPVVGPGANNDVPSLLDPLSENSIISCSDCHSGDEVMDKESNRPRGPHGSIYPSILVRQYDVQNNTSESPSAYALCYGCHDRNSILSNESFSEHRRHIVDENTSCNVCHDPHGISYTQGNSTSNSNLINFDTSVVFFNSMGERRFEDRGIFTGSCSLACHNSDHKNFSY